MDDRKRSACSSHSNALGTPVESLRSMHARVAALARYRTPDDPEFVAARAELERCKEQADVVREGVSNLPPDLWAQLLPKLGKAPAGV